MRKTGIALLTLALIVILCGCATLTADIDIKSGGGADVKVSYAIEETSLPIIQEALGKDPFPALRESLKSADMKVSDFRDGKSLGVSGTTELKNAEDISKLGKYIPMLANLKITEDKDKKTVSLDGNVDIRQMVKDMGLEGFIKTASDLQLADLKLTVTFPSPVKDHNAQSIDNGGKTLIWRLDPSGVLNVHATTSLEEGSLGIWPWVVLGFVVLLAAGTVVLLVMRGKKKRNNTDIV
jgi:hypothetical protein